MPVISVALKPHGRISRARNLAKAASLRFATITKAHHQPGLRRAASWVTCGREPRAPDVLVHVISAVLLVAQNHSQRIDDSLLLFGDTRDTTYRYNMHDIIHLAPCADRLERGTFMLHPLEAYKRVGKRTSDKTSCWMLTCECAVCVKG